MLTSEVENFPGFKEGILGPDLIDNMWKQAGRFGAEFIFDDATSVDFSSTTLKVTVGEKEHEARSVIIATWSSPKWLGLESEERLRGKGVSSCATCDAAFYEGKKVVVVGGGDTAMEEALALASYATEITVVHRRSKLKASKILQERAFNTEKINFIWNATVTEILGEERVEGVRLRNSETGKESKLICNGVFIAIGYEPKTDLIRGQVELDEKGYVVAREMTKTSVEGVFVAGDAHDFRYRQAVLAAGAGCKAALDAERYLREA